MPWWKSSSSSSSSSASSLDRKQRLSSSAGASPSKNTRRESSAFLWSKRGESARPRLERQCRLRPFAEVGVAALNAVSSTPVSRSPSNLDSVPLRLSSSPVLHPLPLPEQLHNNGICTAGSTCAGCRLPSPKGGGLELEEVSGSGVDCSVAITTEVNGERVPAAAGRQACHNTQKSSEHIDRPKKGWNFSSHRKAIHDPKSPESVTFRLNIPAKSAPPSGFSSPALSPRRLSNVDVFHSTFNVSQGLQSCFAPDAPYVDMMISMSPQASPEKIHSSPDRSPLYSPAIKSSVPMSKNPSAPQSPLHPKMYSDGSGAWHDNNMNVHPLPLPPGPSVHVQSSFSHQNVSKNEGALMTSQWQKQKLIGSGTFGNVYKATNRHTGALCAMKEVNIIPDDPKSAECLKQLEQEIRVLSKLKHPNIVQYYGSELTEDHFYIFLEYVYPGSINKYVQEHCGAMTESVVRNFTRHILKGLAYLHSTDNIHRDIKGANLLVDVNGVVKLADFGMAKHLSRAAPALSLKGTPYWMAPEVVQATMSKDVGYDFAVDIWSLGCTIIEMFTGKHPWSGLEGAAAMFKVLHKDPPIPETLSSEGKDFLQRCFRRNPAERPTASMLLDHPFIRNSNHYNLHGSIQAFAGLKLNEITYSPRDKPRSKSEPTMKGRQSANGELNHSHAETSEPMAVRLPPRSAPEVMHSLFPHSNHSLPGPSGSSMNSTNGFHSGSSMNVLNGFQSALGNYHQPASPNNVTSAIHSGITTHHPYALPRPLVKDF
ncbi:mitogen-activated protein kinase kinase kinase 5-like isoform X2 [Phalaenopsis equestris]|uniref:mitogen-activated protein kinase kinase kinase 5-like isoform X2 n=1 Tax=Phalaenopsis equestris TaxID=78828 RepID=UPI0009E4FD57|nr:mitogen-activated protein kinase kinase kinase 5-like isoform X2 [Phalaenopsis equestris]